MQWALLAVIVVALFLLSGRYPKLAFGIFAAMVVAVAGVLFLGQDEATLRKAKISPADITVENTAGAPAYGGGYRLTGRIKNNHSDAELKEVVLSIVMQDCGDSGCQAVGQDRRAGQPAGTGGAGPGLQRHGLSGRARDLGDHRLGVHRHRDPELTRWALTA